ncbi:MAG: radical SAM protein [Candidatus Omnitrophica bacterium]|nr:radical SAM protein [Candidatus Omnitrophota bacterium]
MLRLKNILGFLSRSNIKKIFNYINAYKNYYLGIAKVTSYPLRMSFEPTNRCNLSCALCPTGAGFCKRQRGFMDLDNYIGLIDNIGRYLYSITFAGEGEPLLHPDIFQMISYAVSKKIRVYLNTNLNFASGDIIKQIVDSGLFGLSVSCHGLNQNTISYYMKGGDFSLIMKNVKDLVQLKKDKGKKTPYLGLTFVHMKHNHKELLQLPKFALEHGFDYCSVLPVSLNLIHLPYDKQTDYKYIKHLITEWLPPGHKPYQNTSIIFWYNTMYNEFKCKGILSQIEQIMEFPKMPRISKSPSFKCKDLWLEAEVRWDGEVFPCCRYSFFEDIRFGNVFKDDFLTIFNSSLYVRARRPEVFSQQETGLLCRFCPKMPQAEKLFWLSA